MRDSNHQFFCMDERPKGYSGTKLIRLLQPLNGENSMLFREVEKGKLKHDQEYITIASIAPLHQQQS